MALSNGSMVEIRQVANGYIVMPPGNYDRGVIVTDDERLVFQTFTELEVWLREHFTYRAANVVGDG